MRQGEIGVATDTGELEAIETAVNDSAGQVHALWIAFIIFATYLVIAVGSVTHRMLFLETPIKLPVLDVDLPLVGFFLIAPLVFLVFYFYTLLQLHALSRKLALYNETLTQAFPNAADRRKRRRRLDPFVFVQLLAGTREERLGLTSILSRVVTDTTVILWPILLLLQIQIVFLPYHLQWVTWLHRIEIVAALVLLWYFWPAIRYGRDVVENPPLRRHKIFFAGSVSIAFFSVFIATFPGEVLRNVLTCVAPPIVYASDLLFGGGRKVNEVTGAPRSLFSNVLVLVDQSFVDSEKLGELEKTVSLRGRDLRGAVLVRADLRKADFTGANLNEANLAFARLSGAQFRCAKTGKPEGPSPRATTGKSEGSPSFAFFQKTETPETRWPDDGCTWLQGALLAAVQLQDASLEQARLEGAFLLAAQLQGASLLGAHLQGVNLNFTNLQGASLFLAQLQGASLMFVQLQGASLDNAQLQGATYASANLQGASLTGALFWRIRGTAMSLYLATMDDPIDRAPRFDPNTFKAWRDGILAKLPNDAVRATVKERISVLDPSLLDPSDATADSDWSEARKKNPIGADYEQQMAALFMDLACDPAAAPFVARGLIRTYRIAAAGSHLPEFAEKLRDLKKCSGAVALSADDLANLDRLIKQQNSAPTP